MKLYLILIVFLSSTAFGSKPEERAERRERIDGYLKHLKLDKLETTYFGRTFDPIGWVKRPVIYQDGDLYGTTPRWFYIEENDFEYDLRLDQIEKDCEALVLERHEALERETILDAVRASHE
jgi:hypothetical protein